MSRRTIQAPAPLLFVHHAGIDWIRGSTRCLLDLLTYIDRARFAPIVWCNQPTILAAVGELGVPVYRAENWNGCHPLRPGRAWIAEAGALVRRHGVRLIHADEFTQVSMLMPVARRARIPLLAQLHQVPTADERLWSLLHQVDLAVGTTRACITGLVDDGFPADRAVVIYNGVDPVRLSKGNATTLRPALGIPSHAVVVTILGSLIHRKAVDVALRAFGGLQALDVPCYLLVCGSGPERASLETLAESLGVSGRVRFLGERGEAGAILRDATDILLATSRDESFGLTLAEAGAFGIPAVASSIAAHVEVVGTDAGILVPPEDSARFAESLATLATDPDLRRRLGEAARRRVESMFLIDRYVRDFEDTYSRLLATPPARYGWLHAARWPHAYNDWVRDAVGRRMRGGRQPTVAAGAVRGA
jgi:glycosyltransferase involved in cell wall biosynthesis